eukprot:765142-Hanusia_phi.AAC.4
MNALKLSGCSRLSRNLVLDTPMAGAQKLADLERRINEDVHFLTQVELSPPCAAPLFSSSPRDCSRQERDNYKLELDRFYALPNPCGTWKRLGRRGEQGREDMKSPTGIGCEIEEIKQKLPTGESW